MMFLLPSHLSAWPWFNQYSGFPPDQVLVNYGEMNLEFYVPYTIPGSQIGILDISSLVLLAGACRELHS
jgi:hypothetical protein